MTGSPHLRASRPWALPGLACAMLAILVMAVAAPVQAARTPELPADDAVQASIDPATGRLRDMSAEDARSLSTAMQRMFDRSTEALDPYEFPNGMLMIELPEGYMEATIVQVQPDGSQLTFCAPQRDAAAFMFDPAMPSILLPVWATRPATPHAHAVGFADLPEE